MRIGIDCDGVLTDISKCICEYGERWFKRKPGNLAGYNTSEIFGCSQKEEFQFGLHYFFKYCKEWPPRENAVEIIAMLQQDGHQLYEITARNFTTLKNPLGWYSKYVFRSWLKQNKIAIDKIFYCSEHNSPEDKLKGCQFYDVDLMIDDKPEVAIHLANNGITVLLFDAPYNQDVLGERIMRVMNWNDVYKTIRDIKSEIFQA